MGTEAPKMNHMFTICLFISPDLDGPRAPKKKGILSFSELFRCNDRVLQGQKGSLQERSGLPLRNTPVIKIIRHFFLSRCE
jgi:hypothetical protein